eukprot:scaffold866_cov111-Isochrysis_galbana.AAC.4
MRGEQARMMSATRHSKVKQSTKPVMPIDSHSKTMTALAEIASSMSFRPSPMRVDSSCGLLVIVQEARRPLTAAKEDEPEPERHLDAAAGPPADRREGARRLSRAKAVHERAEDEQERHLQEARQHGKGYGQRDVQPVKPRGKLQQVEHADLGLRRRLGLHRLGWRVGHCCDAELGRVDGIRHRSREGRAAHDAAVCCAPVKTEPCLFTKAWTGLE